MSPVADYEVFDYKSADEPSLGLSEAIEKANRLRREDPSYAFRIVPVDFDQSGFRVVKIPMQEVYGQMWARLTNHLSKYIFSPRSRR